MTMRSKSRAHLDPHWSDWFAGLTLTHVEEDETLLAGSLPDQAALTGCSSESRDLNLKLISLPVRSTGPISSQR